MSHLYSRPRQRHRYPGIPTDVILQTDMLSRIVSATRECIEVYSGRRGRIEDSMVSVHDLLDLGLIHPDDLDKLKRAREG